jgi:hypothetical protein
MKHLLAFALLVVLTAGCKKLVTVDPPVDAITSGGAFLDDVSATAALSGIYSTMMQNYSYFGSVALTLNSGLASDELALKLNQSSFLEIEANEVLPSNGNVYDIWRTAYKYIYQANAAIEGLAQSTTVSSQAKKTLTGEALFVRAFIHFYLVNLFGDVPLVTSSNYTSNAVLGRTPAADVYRQVVEDLQRAESLLPPVNGTGKARPGSDAVKAMLARVYLYRGDWALAESKATEVIASGRYTLANTPAQVFLSSSPETIWQLTPSVANINTYEGNQLIPSTATAVPSFVLTDALLGFFGSTDLRRKAWLDSNLVSGRAWYYPAKYKVRTAAAITENPIYLRLAELYLIRSEARAQQDKISGAQQDLSAIRSRAGLGATPASDKASLLAAIEGERRLELFVEWGHRWFDLKRWGRAGAVLSYKPGWQSTDTLWPLPVGELKLNPFLTQNPGY